MLKFNVFSTTKIIIISDWIYFSFKLEMLQLKYER